MQEQIADKDRAKIQALEALAKIQEIIKQEDIKQIRNQYREKNVEESKAQIIARYKQAISLETTIRMAYTQDMVQELNSSKNENFTEQIPVSYTHLADSFFFEQGDSTALIDCGTRSTGKDVVQHLKDQGITKIDYVFGTHPHDDHMGGMYDVITNFEVGTIVLPDVTDTITTNWYLKLMNEISTGNYTTEYAEVGTTYNLSLIHI